MSRKTLAIALFASLALNLFLVGAVAGGLVVGHRVRGGEHSAGLRAPPPVWRAGEVLSEDQAQAYRAALRGEGRAAREAMRAARTARLDAWRSLEAQPFDPQAAKARLAEIRGQEADARGQIENRIVDFAAGLSPADRAALAKGLTAQRREDRGPPRRDDPSGPGRSGRDAGP